MRESRWLISSFAIMAQLACGRQAHMGQCAMDADCASSFCDRDTCTEPGQPDTYGRSCGPVPLNVDTGEPDWSLDVCGGYQCIEGRCRSCFDDQECVAKASGLATSIVTCGLVPGWRGRSCGNYSFVSDPADASPPSVLPEPPLSAGLADASHR